MSRGRSPSRPFPFTQTSLNDGLVTLGSLNSPLFAVLLAPLARCALRSCWQRTAREASVWLPGG